MLQKLLLQSSDATTKLATAFAPFMTAGSTILLNGVVGAGKTHFARQLILARLIEIDAVEDIPSPTFTLVQTYELNDVDIWHTDLYRLIDFSEVYELGLDTAFDTAICLIEWSDRLGELTPKNALSLNLSITDDDARLATLEWRSDTWTPIIKNVLKVMENASA